MYHVLPSEGILQCAQGRVIRSQTESCTFGLKSLRSTEQLEIEQENPGSEEQQKLVTEHHWYSSVVQLLVWHAWGPGFKAQSLALQEKKDLVDSHTVMSETFRTQGGNNWKEKLLKWGFRCYPPQGDMLQFETCQSRTAWSIPQTFHWNLEEYNLE